MPALRRANIKWLATEALLMLPFISDFLSWNGVPSFNTTPLLLAFAD